LSKSKWLTGLGGTHLVFGHPFLPHPEVVRTHRLCSFNFTFVIL